MPFRDQFLKDFFRMEEEMQKWFEHIFRSKKPIISLGEEKWQPATDVYETDRALVVTVELAGVSRDKIHLAIDKEKLVIKGTRGELSKEDKKAYHIMEIHYGPFERIIPLTVPVDEDKVKATYEKGFLRIILPKAKESEIKRVEITVEE